jgi:hypothetical protein
MSGFTDLMIDAGFSDAQEYMEYLENRAIGQMGRDNYEDEDYLDDNEDEYQESSDDGYQTWGQKRRLCDIADNCYGCPYAAECF